MAEELVNVTKWPVLVYANYRTGSSRASKQISNFYNAEWFSEPTKVPNEKLIKFKNFYHSGNKKFVLKIMPDQIYEIPEFQEIINSDCFKIKMLRKNELDQIVSYYISYIRNNWVQFEKTIKNYYVNVDYTIIEHSINVIRQNNEILKNSNLNFDATLYYEDLNFNNEDPILKNERVTYKTTPPVNIGIVLQAVKRIYEQR